MKSKTELRREMRILRKGVDADLREKASSEVVRRILSREDVLWAIAEHKPFAVYMASRDELDLTELIEKLWAADVTVAVPCWDAAEKNYQLGVYANTTALIEGAFGIDEPAELNPVACEDIAVWIVPGLAFTRAGGRLGYGGGWYDRLLSHAAPNAVTLGVGYGFQCVNEIPSEPHDIPLTAFVSAD